jgi:hypothetical protein
MSEITHWNYRVVKHKDMPGWTSDMAIHEAYYEDDGGIAVTENPIRVWGSTIDELRSVLNCMLLALDNPILDMDGKEIGD